MITVAQNRQIGSMSNEALVARLRQLGIVIPKLPTRLRIPEGMGVQVNNAQMLQALTDLRQGLTEVKMEVRDKKLLQLNIDNGGIAAAMTAHQSRTTYHANQYQF